MAENNPSIAHVERGYSALKMPEKQNIHPLIYLPLSIHIALSVRKYLRMYRCIHRRLYFFTKLKVWCIEL